MRQMSLDGRDGLCADGILRDKLAGHLCARLNEYEEDGIQARMAGPGEVLARFDGMTGEQAVCALTRQGIFALAVGDAVRFVIGPEVCFEDLDYVQSAAAQLLG